MKILNAFPQDAVFGRCLAIKGEHSGRCVDLGVLAADLPRKQQRLVISEVAVRGMAGHFGMVDERVHAEVAAENDVLRSKLEHAATVIAGLMGALQALDVPIPAEPEPPQPKTLMEVFALEAAEHPDEVESEVEPEASKTKSKKKAAG